MSIVPGRDVPEVPQEWVDAVNKAVNDANHEDLCGCAGWPNACQWYTPGQWDIGVDLTIAVGALEPLMRERAAETPDALAAQLAATVADLQAYIEVRADEIAGPLITATQEKATEQVADLRHEAAMQKQRDDDLIAELRRQLDAAVKYRHREFDELKRLRATVHRVRRLPQSLAGPDAVSVVNAADLFAALDGEGVAW